MEIYRGRGVHPGIAVGPVFVLAAPAAPPKDTPAADAGLQWEAYLDAREQADLQLDALYRKTLAELGESEAMIVDVQRMMLQDEDWNEMIGRFIRANHNSAAHAVSRAGSHFSAVFAALEDDYMQARAADIQDICRRLVGILSGNGSTPRLTEPSIVLADDISPSETLQLNKSMILAFATRHGSVNSHSAILARMMNIPSIVQAGFPQPPPGAAIMAAVDGAAGVLYLEPDDTTLDRMNETRLKHYNAQRRLQELHGLPTVTKDGHTVQLLANIGGVEGMRAAVGNDAEGIGLFRSEFLFLGRHSQPTEQEQYEAYRAVAEGMQGRPVIIRTLDIGADKQAAYLKLPREANPALGYRAIRVSVDRPKLFRTQLRAILRAAACGNVSVLLPLITSVWEVRTCKKMLAQAKRSLQRDGLAAGEVKLGLMIETPAAVMIADELAKECDFFSVGTNDLAQYTLAIDRQNTRLEAFYDPRHPALLRMLAMAAESATKAGIPISICGELAADHQLTETFLRMGFSGLSVSPGYILGLRGRIRSLSLAGAEGGRQREAMP